MVIAQNLQKQELLPLVSNALQTLFNLKVNNSKHYQLLKISICIELYVPQACFQARDGEQEPLRGEGVVPFRGKARSASGGLQGLNPERCTTGAHCSR